MAREDQRTCCTVPRVHPVSAQHTPPHANTPHASQLLVDSCFERAHEKILKLEEQLEKKYKGAISLSDESDSEDEMDVKKEDLEEESSEEESDEEGENESNESNEEESGEEGGSEEEDESDEDNDSDEDRDSD